MENGQFASDFVMSRGMRTSLDIVLNRIISGGELVGGSCRRIVGGDGLRESLKTGLYPLVAGLELRVHVVGGGGGGGGV